MNEKHWIAMAIKEKRICSTCSRPIAKKYWASYLKRGHCFDCHLAHHWSDNLGAGGSSRFDNRTIEEDLEYQYYI